MVRQIFQHPSVIHEDYPEQECLHIYTEGSSIPCTGNTVAAYYSLLFQGHFAVGAPLSNYDGELAATLLKTIFPLSKAVFYT